MTRQIEHSLAVDINKLSRVTEHRREVIRWLWLAIGLLIAVIGVLAMCLICGSARSSAAGAESPPATCRPAPALESANRRETTPLSASQAAGSTSAGEGNKKIPVDGGAIPATPAVTITASGARPKGLLSHAPGADIYSAIRQVESGGNDYAVGDDGTSRGPYQIQAGYWKDGGGDLAQYLIDVWDAAKCEKIMLGYWKRYCPGALAAGDLQALARVHNGGPKGDRKAATVEYWRRVSRELREQKNLIAENAKE